MTNRTLTSLATAGLLASQLSGAPRTASRDAGSCVRVDTLGELHCDPARRDGYYCETTAEGYLRCTGRLTRLGVFKYFNEAGDQWGELRTEEHVFSPESVRSWELQVVTDDHPEVMVTADTAKSVEIGTVGQDIRREGDYLVATIVIRDPAAIAKIRAGKVQLSCGYYVTPVQVTGELDGEPYSFIQTVIIGNHVALVMEGRAGAACRLMLDSAAQAVGGTSFAYSNATHGDHMSKPKNDLEPDQTPAPAPEGEKPAPEGEKPAPSDMPEWAVKMGDQLTAMAAMLAQLIGEESSEGAEGDEPADPKPAEGEPAPAPAPEGEKPADPAPKPEDEKVDAALALSASRILGGGFKVDGKSRRDVQHAVVCRLMPGMAGQLANADSGYIASAYEFATSNYTETLARSACDAARSASSSSQPQSVSLDGLRASMMNRLANRHRA